MIGFGGRLLGDTKAFKWPKTSDFSRMPATKILCNVTSAQVTKYTKPKLQCEREGRGPHTSEKTQAPELRALPTTMMVGHSANTAMSLPHALNDDDRDCDKGHFAAAAPSCATITAVTTMEGSTSAAPSLVCSQ